MKAVFLPSPTAAAVLPEIVLQGKVGSCSRKEKLGQITVLSSSDKCPSAGCANRMAS